MTVQPDIGAGGLVPPRPSPFEPIVRIWFGLLDAMVWCLTLSTGRVVRRQRDIRHYQTPPIG